MSSTKSKVWIMAKKFVGAPKLSDFAVVEQELAPIKDGEFLCKAEWLSVDPYQRAYATRFPDGTPMIGYQVAEILESKAKDFPVGKRVVGHFGWRTHTVVNPTENAADKPYILPELCGLPNSAGVGILGMPGMTAYFGLTDCCQPKAGETVVVNAAAGAVGSAVGQIGKILVRVRRCEINSVYLRCDDRSLVVTTGTTNRPPYYVLSVRCAACFVVPAFIVTQGCRVIGYAGDDEKVEWLKKDLGFDAAFNYKKVDLGKSLKEAAPKGVDCFFDNVGGKFALTVYEHMNQFGRICQCGSISGYNNTQVSMVPEFLHLFIFKELCLKGFYASSSVPRWPQGMKTMGQWIKEDKLKFKETVMDGFNNMPQALIDLLEGKNFGKMIVKASLGTKL